MASLAGLDCLSLRVDEDSEYVLRPAEEEVMDIAEEGRVKGAGEVERNPKAELLRADALLELLAPQVSGEKREREDGCWRTQNTKVLLMTKRAHCGCAT